MTKRVSFAARFATALFCTIGLLLPWLGESRAASAPQLPGPGLPVIAVIGCKLVGGTLVCGRDGTLLPNRLRRPKAKVKEPKKEYQPQKKTQSKQSPSSKKSGTAAKPAPAEVEETDSDDAATEAEEDKADDTAGHTCPPGNVVLEKANAAGSFCEPVNKQTPAAAPALTAPAPTTAPAPAPAAVPAPTPPPQTSTGTDQPGERKYTAPPSPPAASGTPQPSANPTSQTPALKPQICCSAQAVDPSGRPHPGDGTIFFCASSEKEAKTLLEPYAKASNYRLTGPINCNAR